MHRGGKVYDEFCDALVENCVIWNDWGRSLEIGAETRAEKIENIIYRKCDVIHVLSSVLDCQNVDYADVNNVLFEDINIETDELIPPPVYQRNDAEVYKINRLDHMPAAINVSVMFHQEYSAGGKRRGRNRNIIFHNIRVYGSHTPPVCVYGYDAEHKCENILISELYLNDEKNISSSGKLAHRRSYRKRVNRIRSICEYG